MYVYVRYDFERTHAARLPDKSVSPKDKRLSLSHNLTYEIRIRFKGKISSSNFKGTL